MNRLDQNKLVLLGRSEGKLKSYKSCVDVRAWSHDQGARDKYLREWIKCDMPICVLPFGSLASFLKIMTCRRRGKATPHCHPDCKSRILLDSICASCDAVRECLESNENFEKFFEEEKVETNHWPCEKCFNALKSVKMFWRILLVKVFQINLPRSKLSNSNFCKSNCIRSVAKYWQNEIIDQAQFVKTILDENAVIKPKFVIFEDTQILDTRADNEIERNTKKIIKKNRGTSIQIKVAEVGCNCYDEETNEKIAAFKYNINYLQEQYNDQLQEMERLQKENELLNIELQNIYKSNTKFGSSRASHNIRSDVFELAPNPFETSCDENLNYDNINAVNSEMIITMKDFQTESRLKHVSLLQVLHKKNGPIKNNTNSNEVCFKKEDPIDLLTKVKKTFGAIVQREMSIAIARRNIGDKSDISATYHKVIGSKSVPSCSTVSFSASIGSTFASAKN